MMAPKYIQVDSQNPDPDRIAEAAAVLRAGGLVAFPTETVYGLGANALDSTAVEKIFAAKQRPKSDPLIVHIASLETLETLSQHIPDTARLLMERFFPGALTLLFPRSARVPLTVTAGLDSVAVRMPAHPVALALIRAAGVPVAAPSANLFMHPSPTTAQHVLEDLGDRVDVILDGGPCPIGVESTVLDFSSSPPRVLRPGGVPVEALRTVLPDLAVAPRYLKLEEEKLDVATPGMHFKHYSPEAAVVLVLGEPGKVQRRMLLAAERLLAQDVRVGVLGAREDEVHFASLPVTFYGLGAAGNLEEIARNLFAAIRALDKAGCQVILARDFGDTGVGLAVRDRLFRAAEGQKIEAASSAVLRVKVGTKWCEA